jgi:hypothetical protein
MSRPERGSTLARPVLDEPECETVLRALAGKTLAVSEEPLTVRQAAEWLREHDYSEQYVAAFFAAVDDHMVYVVRGDGWRLLSPDFADGEHFILMTPAEEES